MLKREIEEWLDKRWHKEIYNNLGIWFNESDRTFRSLIGIFEANGKYFIREIIEVQEKAIEEQNLINIKFKKIKRNKITMKNDTKTIKAIKGKFFNKITIQEEVNIPPEIIKHLRQKWQQELRKKIFKIETPPVLTDEEADNDERYMAIQEGAKLGFDYAIWKISELLEE